jgi:dihydroorotate dehydrogenase
MADIYKNLLRPLFFRMEPEEAHDSACYFLKLMASLPFVCDVFRKYNLIEGDKPIELFGLEFPNRVGLAAGMDKDGQFPSAIEAFGFGHVEVGTVTPEAQPGNPRPRLFRETKHNGLINRMGFNNKGAEAMLRSLEQGFPRNKRKIPLGVNIGKAKVTPLEKAVEDYSKSFSILADQADYFTINVSSPNTQNLRQLQSREYLSIILDTLQKQNLALSKKMGRSPHPILLKIAPDLSFEEIDVILELLLEYNYSGIIASNTTIQRPENIIHDEMGGYSGGAFIHKLSNEVIRYISKATDGRLPIVGVGGIDSPESAGEKIDAGASLVQIYTSWIYNGPLFGRELARALQEKDKTWV